MDSHVYKIIGNVAETDTFRVNAFFYENRLNLTILQKSSAWVTTVTKVYIEEQAGQLGSNVEAYYQKLKDYFSNTPANIRFTFNNNEFIVCCLTENNIKIKYFSCTLNKVNYCDCVEELLDSFYTEKVETAENFDIIRHEKHESEKGRVEFESRLKEFVDKKKTDDQELLNNFALVLNEKKRRIQHLSELLEALKQGRPSTNPLPNVAIARKNKLKEKSLKKQPKKEELSNSDSDSPSENYETDDETDEQIKKEIIDETKGNINTEPGPSTSKRPVGLFDDDSPPSTYALLKRVKSDTIIASININNTHKPKDSQASPKLESKKDEEAVKAPVIDFNTQELFDNFDMF